MFIINNIFLKELFLQGLHLENEEEEVSYDFFPGSYIQHLNKCKRHYRNSHLDPLALWPDPSPSSNHLPTNKKKKRSMFHMDKDEDFQYQQDREMYAHYYSPYISTLGSDSLSQQNMD